MPFPWDSMNPPFSGERQLRFSWGVLMMSQTGSITFVIYGLGVGLRASPVFSEAEIGQT